MNTTEPLENGPAARLPDDLRADRYPEAVREAAVAKAHLHPDMTVGVIGTGIGGLAARLEGLVRHVYVVGSSPALRAAAGGLPEPLAGGASCVAGLVALPFEDGSLDGIFAEVAFGRGSDPEAAIAGLARVVRPGGRLVLIGPIGAPDGPHPGEPDIPKPSTAGARPSAAAVCMSAACTQVKALMRQAGLVNIIVEGFSEPRSGHLPGETGAAQATAGVLLATASRRVVGAREAVQAGYGALATGGQSCCGPGIPASPEGACCGSPDASALVEADQPEVVFFDTGYTPEQLAAVPLEAARLALGCGNPTALASLHPGEVVVDIGSGAGIDAFYAAKRVGAQGRVIGLDMTPAMIEEARRSASDAGLTNVEFRLGQAEAMPIEDGVADVVLSNCVINLAEDKGRVFEEAYRVLKEGGLLCVSDMVTASALPMSLRGDPQAWAGCVNGALPEQEYLDLVAQAGFTDIVAQRTLSSGMVAGVPVYSLSVSARKGWPG